MGGGAIPQTDENAVDTNAGDYGDGYVAPNTKRGYIYSYFFTRGNGLALPKVSPLESEDIESTATMAFLRLTIG